jgi:hypothetical protein
MPISLTRIAITGDEPLTLAALKQWLVVDQAMTDDDALLTALCTAARQRAETITGRCLIPSTWTYGLEAFPYGWWEDSAPSRNSYSKMMSWWGNAQNIRLPQSPVQTVTSINYLGAAGTYTTLDPSQYVVDYASEPCIVSPAYGSYWPTTLAQHNAVQITFNSGYDSVPQDILSAMMIMAGGWYMNREDSGTVPKAAEYLLSSYVSQPLGFIR